MATYLTQLLEPFTNELAQGSFVPDLQGCYREVLEQDGVVFARPEVLRAAKLYTAQAAVDRGAPALEDDGSAIDLSNFDRNEAGEMLRANREPLHIAAILSERLSPS